MSINDSEPENPFEENHELDKAGYEEDVSSSESSDYITEDEKAAAMALSLEKGIQNEPERIVISDDDDDVVDSRKFEVNMQKMLNPPPPCYEIEVEGYNTWELTDLLGMNVEKWYGPKFQVGEFEFNLLLMSPKTKPASVYSVYLEGHPIDKALGETDDWHCCVQFGIDAWDPANPSIHKANMANHRYTSKVTDWGFVGHLNTRLVQDSRLIKNNKINITAYVRIIKDHTGVLWHDFLDYDSKKETGFVGINNQGATCYLNSLLQSYYFTKVFRKKVYQIPTQDELSMDLPTFQQYLEQPKSVSLALQRIFYNLQTSDKPIDTLELTHSFGWNSADAFTQHDVQELNRILMDRLESKMKNTDIAGCLTDIFVGNMKSFIRCVNVDYESSRTEDFWDIQLNVKNLKNIKESFENYIELEMLDGDNKYEAPGYGLQDAEKGVVFESFPPVLHLQLKRFEYDFEYDRLIKINDRYEYFDQIDLKPYLDKDCAHYDEDWEYQLHGVLVHQGDVSMGHYYAMIRPSLEDEWFRFEDDRVWKVTPHEVFEGNFGADRLTTDLRNKSKDEQQEYQMKRHTSAYMLVYIRKSRVADMLADVTEEDTPLHLAKQINYELEERERLRKEQEEMHLYANLKIYTGKGFLKYEGFDLGPNEEDKINYSEDFYDPESNPIKIRMLKSEPFSKVYELVAEKLGEKSDPKEFRFWNIVSRHSSAVRPSSVIPYQYDDPRYGDVTVGQIVKHAESSLTRRRRANQSSQAVLFLEESSKSIKFISHSYYKLKQEGSELFNEITQSEPINDKYGKLCDIIPSHFSPKIEAVSSSSNNALIFIKYFDQEKQILKGISHLIVSLDSQVEYLTEILNNIMDFDIGTPLRFYEELGPNQIQHLSSDVSFYKSEIGHGDIICFTKAASEIKPSSEGEFKSVDEYYSFLANRVHFRVTPLIKADEDEEEYVKVDIEEPSDKENDPLEKRSNSIKSQKQFDLWFSTSSSYKSLANKIGAHIKVNPEYLRIFILGHSNQRIPFKKDTNFRKLIDKTPKSQTLDLQYEILNVTLTEFEEMKLCKVSWVGQGICREQKHEFFLPRSSTIETLIDRLQMKVNISGNDRDNLVCWAANKHLLAGVYNLDHTIDELDQVIIGNYPSYKKILAEGSDSVKLITGFQFFGKIQNRHSIPFIFDLIKGEPFTETKVRLHKLLGMSEKEFNSVRIAVSNLEDAEYLDIKERENMILYDISSANHLYICIDHPDRSVRRGSTFEPSIFIRE
ncbi:hypothetical protein CANARDRAFT_25963 [[Candida] arabinofermentans NRRL YB-2248]|uniref:ubiquitinyl hydrolase 1 n=1 Tax=[Candida] arabinofermentans NRRL YB-2248 TaxID=983967 RepID=A0A1E4T7P7_9ASCO|nr:hypothetical protein CANARDRAFT_25963 [[Candida] arabinofermentans NRRL YB-2248]